MPSFWQDKHWKQSDVQERVMQADITVIWQHPELCSTILQDVTIVKQLRLSSRGIGCKVAAKTDLPGAGVPVEVRVYLHSTEHALL